MAVAFTTDQRAVIEARKQNILVSAAAGSGKTAVLVQRIVELVCDAQNPVDVDHLLVVTFTEAAAAEMKGRVAKALNKRLEEEYLLDDESPEHEVMIAHLEKQNVLIHRSFIMTIDAFCKFIVTNNYSEAGVEPGFRVMDEGEKSLLQQEVIEELFEKLYSEENLAFYEAIEGLSERGRDEELKELILKLYSTSESFPWPDRWLEKACEGYKVFDHNIWLESLIEDVKLRLTCAISELNNARMICMESPVDLAAHIEILNNDIINIQNILSATMIQEDCIMVYDAIEQAIANKPDYQTWSRSGKEKELKNKAKALRDDAKKILEKIIENYFFVPRSVWQQELEETGARVDTVIGLVREFGKRFGEAKAKDSLVDFSDLEHMALKVLLVDGDEKKPSEIAKEYQQYFAEIMIDEYQDSNEVQEVLLQALCREHLSGDMHQSNRFMVGDVKQSIYRFRKADPGLIIQKMKSYRKENTALNRRIDLQSNFRSRKEVLDCVNSIFEKIMIPEVGGVAYDEAARLNLGSTIYDDTEKLFNPELHLLGMDDTEADSFETQVHLLADIIDEQIKNGRVSADVDIETGKAKLRPVKYGDIAILMRAVKAKGDTIRKVFGQRGIPVKVISAEKYYNSLEVSQVLQYLKILDNPLQDVAFYGVCRSPMGGFSDEEMAWIAVEYPEEHYFNKFKNCIKDYVEGEKEGILKESGVANRIDTFLDVYNRLRNIARYENIEHLIARIYELTEFRYYVCALPEGESRLNNLELLLERARLFAQTNYSGIFNFLQYVDKLMDSEKEPAGAGGANEGNDEVKVYTMHKSKGLEFPVCIVCDLQTKFNLRDGQIPFLLDNKMGVACNYTDTTRRVRRDTLMRKVFSVKEDIDTKGENLRILYVALTRAKEKLIMVGNVPQPSSKAKKSGDDIDIVEAYIDSWENKWETMGESANYSQISGCGSFLDMIMYGFAGYKNNIIAHKASDRYDHIIENTTDAIEKKENDKILAWAIDNSGDTYAEFEHNMALPYCQTELEGLYTKTSVSELKMAAMQDTMEGEGPRWVYEESHEDTATHNHSDAGVNRGALYGTAQHRIMELISFSEAMDYTSDSARKTWLDAKVKSEYENGRIEQDIKDLINVKRISAFLDSEYAHRMGEAEKVRNLFKEQPFFLSVPANELDKKYPETESLLIQGIIDVYWIEKNEIVLLDYKTDNVADVSELVTRYKTQMDYYARALTQGTGMKIKERILYSFKLNEFVVI